MPWRIEYDNDTGAGDEGFWQWWTVTNNVQSYRVTSSEDDAKELLAKLESHAALVASERRLREALEKCATELWKKRTDDDPLLIAARAALEAKP